MITEALKRAQLKYRQTAFGKASNRRYQNSPAGKRAMSEGHLLRSYGITLADKERIYSEQKGLCKICFGRLISVSKAHTDHNHLTGEIRGLLCFRCNALIGWIETSKWLLLRVFRYLGWSSNDLF